MLNSVITPELQSLINYICNSHRIYLKANRVDLFAERIIIFRFGVRSNLLLF